jgi:hypothetical protein
MTDRERRIARRVRKTLHLQSMTEQEIVRELRGSYAWRRERFRLAREEMGEALWDALQPVRAWGQRQAERGQQRLLALWRRLRK